MGIKLTLNNLLSQDLSIHHKCYFHSDPFSISLGHYPWLTWQSILSQPSPPDWMLPSRKVVVSFESCGMSIQLKLLWQFFHIIFFFSACFETNKIKKFRRVLTLAVFSSDHERVRYIYVFASVLFPPVQFSDKRLHAFLQIRWESKNEKR